ncbi:MAG: T9SS type A sorting domain-containing protein [Bacteroidetes bacterium]|nr:T9SS type A sorting domain-containing protein [Bacteroidota bacterium]
MEKKTLMLSLLCMVSIVTFAQLPGSFESRGIGGGGALFAPSINPANDNEYYIGCDMGALYHTTNFGLSYDQIPFKQAMGGHNTTVCFTNNTLIRYIIGRKGDQNIPMKSVDGGITWNECAGNIDSWETTYTIYVDYNNPNRVLMAYYSTVYFSSNGGTTFTAIHQALDANAGVLVGGAFFDGNSIYIGTSDGLLSSVNGGTSFSRSAYTGFGAGELLISMTGAKVGNTTRLFCLTTTNGAWPNLTNDVGNYYDILAGVYSMDVGAGNWVKKMTGINVAQDFLSTIRMATNNINVVYASGSNSNGMPEVMKSVDAGANWTHIFNTSTNQNISTGWSGDGGDRGWGYGEYFYSISVSPLNANKAIVSDMGFVHKTADGGTSWQQAYVSAADQHAAGSATPPNQSYHSVGIENTSCWQVEWIDKDNLFACYSDIKGIRSTDGGLSWSFNYTGHNANTMYRIAKHSNGTLYAGTSNIHDMYQSTRLADNILDGNDAEGKIIFSTNKGATWQLMHSFNHPVFWVALDPNNSNRMYASVVHYGAGAGVGGIYVCNNIQNGASSTWIKLSNPPRTQGHPASIVVLNDGKVLCTYSGRRSTSFTNSSGVFIYDPIGAQWSDVSDPGMYYWTKDVVVDPFDVTQNTWYVSVFSGWGGAPNGLGGLYRTSDRGLHWSKISDLDRVTSCTFNPKNKNDVFLTTEATGLWYSSNINAVTPVFTEVDDYPFQQPERVFFNPYNENEVWVTSFGNGMRMGLISTTGIQFENLEDQISLFPNPASEQLFISLPKEVSGEVSISIIDICGRTIRTTSEHRFTNENISLNVQDLSAGLYVVKVNNNQHSSSLLFQKK